MSVKDTLEQLLKHEAEKLLKLSTEKQEPLDDQMLERVALLARCAKAVRSQTSAQNDGDPQNGDDKPVEELLKAAES